MKIYFASIVFFVISYFSTYAQLKPPSINGVFPNLTLKSDMTTNMSEAGVGALINWADKLWAVGYVAHIRGSGVGLYEINEDMTMRRHPMSHTGTFTNRYIHDKSMQALIGPYLISAKGEVKIFHDLKMERLTATMTHLSKPDSMVYYLTMEGNFYEANVYTLKTTLLYNLIPELEIDKKAYIHFKSGFTAGGKVYVANNSYYEEEFNGTREAGRLGEWDGKTWKVIDKNPYVEVSGKIWSADFYGHSLFATGWDRSSVILKFLKNGAWKTYRLPKASYAYDHAWNTEWMRIREANTERYLMDAHGIFYEIPTITYNGNIMGIRPICNHLRMVPDFIHWRGLFVMGSDQADKSSGQPQSGLWFGNIDDLWNFGKPKGIGGPWYEADVKAETPSDPYLMNGFDQKTVHIHNLGDEPIEVKLQVDFLSNDTWHQLATISLPAKGYSYYVFPTGFSAQWLRAVCTKDTKLTVQCIYN